MTSTINLICFKCKHWKAFDTGCNAFDEIPDKVLLENKHDKKLKGQKLEKSKKKKFTMVLKKVI